MLSLTTSRGLRTLALVLVVLSCTAAVGATCAVCVTGHPGQAIERTLISVPVATPPPRVVLWGIAIVLAFAPFLVVRARLVSAGRSSPAELQRFLF